MSEECSKLHKIFQKLERFRFPFDENRVPKNGVYILFEDGEKAHNGDRIVRIGTHTGDNQLRSRLNQHFTNENKDRSIFRKNIGRCILNKRQDPYMKTWELDCTTREQRDRNSKLINIEYQKEIEKEISSYIQTKFSFCVIEIETKDERLLLESKLISTVSLCKECFPSHNWLGLDSPKQKIRESGLWLVNELYKEPLTTNDIYRIKEKLRLC